jgi:REP element-mobilizing transposase RayT
MARPLRLEFAGALYHITSRGDRREDIYRNDGDRKQWLELLAQVCARFNWVVHSYCQMTSHYHLLVETVDGDLSRGMRQLNGVYTQTFNRKYHESGHLFQGRFKAILVQKEAHLLELSRYIVLNPVRANMVMSVEDWIWSSYNAMVKSETKNQWLDIDWTLSQFDQSRTKAISAYQKFVLQGKGLSDPKEQVKHQMFLGSNDFITEYQQTVEKPEKSGESLLLRKLILSVLALIRPASLIKTLEGFLFSCLKWLDAMPESLVFSLRKKTLRENTRYYRYHGLKIFTSPKLRFQDFQRT